MVKIVLVFIITLLCSFHTVAAEGLITVESRFKVAHTADRFKGIVQKHDFIVFNHIYHSNNARSAGKKILPTELVIFGKPEVDALLMACSPTIGVDLPQKLLVWQDENAQTFMTYNNPQYIADRHNLDEACRTHLNQTAEALVRFTKRAGDIR